MIVTESTDALEEKSHKRKAANALSQFENRKMRKYLTERSAQEEMDYELDDFEGDDETLAKSDHEFMQRLFQRWDVDNSSTLTLQNVVTGLARIKSKRDIMGAMNYFFDLHDDDLDGT